MDAASLRRFHSSTVSWPSDPFFIPSGGLARFLREMLRFQVSWCHLDILSRGDMFNVRVCMQILVEHVYFAAQVHQNELRGLFSRYNTPTAAWMFHVLLVLIKVVGFDGDNGPPECGCTPIQVAAAKIEFLLQQCADTFMMHRSTDRTTFLDYEEYDPHRTVEGYFSGRRLPEEYTHIKIGSPSVPEFDPTRRNEYWLEAERVVEATLISLSQIKGSVRVETGKDGEVLGVCKESVDELVSDMVASGTQDTARANRFKAYSYVACLQRGLSPSLFTDVEGPAIGISVWVPVLEAVESEGSGMVHGIKSGRPTHVNTSFLPTSSRYWQRRQDLTLGMERMSVAEAGNRLRMHCPPGDVDENPPVRKTVAASLFMQRVLRPAVYPPPLLDDADTKFMRQGLRSLLDALHNIVLPNSFRAEYNLHSDRESAREEAIPVDGRAFRMMEILEYLVFCYGYDGFGSAESQHLLTTVTRLRAVASAWVTITEARMGILQREYDEFRSSGEPRPRTIPQLLELLEQVQVPELEISQGAKWKPIIPISEIMRRVVRPAVYLFQRILDRLFCDPSPHVPPPSMFTKRLRRVLRGILDLLPRKLFEQDLITHQQPSGPCYQEIWHQTSSCHAVPVSDLCWRMLGLTNYFVMCCGFEGEETPSGMRLFNSLQKLRKVSKTWWMVTESRGEFWEFSVTGELIAQSVDFGCQSAKLRSRSRSLKRAGSDKVMNRVSSAQAYDMSHLQDDLSGLTPACQLRVLLSPIAPSAAERALGEKWIPPIAFPDYLHLLIRPSVYYIQNVVDDDFRMSSDTPVFPPMDHQAIRYAMRVIVEQMGVNVVGIEDVMIPGESSQMFRIIEFLLSRVGFEGDDQASLEGALKIARKLSGLAEDWAALTGCAQEYAEYRGGKFERRLAECCVPRSIASPSPMPVRFALLSEAPPIYPVTQCRDSFEVFYVDLLTWDGLQAYAARPDIVQYSENVLCPLRDVAVEVRGRFEFRLPNPSDAPWLRSRLAAYLHFASFIAEAISICSVILAVAIPTPSISCLIYMNRLILRYGFEGDEDADSKIDALEKFASVIHIAQGAREDSDTRILGWKCLDTLEEEFEAWNAFPNN
ncbi:hypothetical protein B0H10DRAFT_1943093 [Mycena sp. CBHHK59/15]|nr:hypothetical protein B0H10DRAFT_1943093 [Mycena sp. CBHHK59/15]